MGSFEGGAPPKPPASSERATLLLRAGLLLLLGVVLLIAKGVGLFEHLKAPPALAAYSAGPAARGRAERVQPAAVVALAPLAVSIPIVERPGTDSDGYPLSYVDKAALRSLLARAKYRELSDYFEQFQRELEADFRHEYFVIDSAEAFETAELELGPELDAWLAATPDSFAPYLARGSHRFAAGVAGRGFELADKTHPDNFRAMDVAFDPAWSDLEQALRKKPRAIAALRYELRIAFIGSDHQDDFLPLARRAAVMCPGCFQFQMSYQVGLQPRWHGSYEAMAAAAHAVNPSLNSRFRLLPGYADIDRANVARRKGDLDVALKYAEQACALGDNADFLLEKAYILFAKDDTSGAAQVLTRALTLRPNRADLMFERADAYSRPKSRDWQAAYSDLSQALRIAPASIEAHDTVPEVAHGLTVSGWEAHQRGDELSAIRLLDEASELAPSGDLEARRSAVLTAGFHGTEPEIAALTNAANALPHDFYAHERLDYALSTLRDWNRIAAMWAAYIAENPDDGRAHYELGGTFQNQGQLAAAKAEAQRGCELGVSASCAQARLH
jgi:hypothetical protein